MLDNESLNEIRKRELKATPGPWISGHFASVHQRGDDAPYDDLLFNAFTQADAEFSAHARQDIPALLDMLQELHADRDHYKEMFEAVIKKGADIEADRDRWIVRGKALERAIVQSFYDDDGLNVCDVCIHGNTEMMEEPCYKCLNENNIAWEFNEARFASEAENENASDLKTI